MWISVGNVRSKVTRAKDEEREWLQLYLTFEGEQRGRSKANDTCLLNIFDLTYPSGFNSMIAKAAKADGVKVEFLDTRQKPCRPDVDADLDWLRDYQFKAVIASAKRTRGILWLPTGAGKTEIIVGITRLLPCKWLALVHRSQLADDIASRWEKRTPGLLAGRILEGRFDVPEDATLVSATYQTLREALASPSKSQRERAARVLAEAQGLLVDEVHTAPAETYLAILMKTRHAYYRFGLSGTPLARTDAKSQFAIAAIGPVIYKIEPQLLIDRGVLAQPTVRMGVVDQWSLRPTWQGAYGELIVRSKVRNAKVMEYAKKATKPGFIFIEQSSHGRILRDEIFRAGMKAEFVYGKHSVDYRKSLIRRLVQGHFDMLVCSRVFNEGIDVPELRSVINAAGGKSIIATLQRLGRGMRVDRDGAGNVRDGGDQFEVYDIMDRGNAWLEKHAKVRRDAYIEQGYKLHIEEAQAAMPKRQKRSG